MVKGIILSTVPIRGIEIQSQKLRSSMFVNLMNIHRVRYSTASTVSKLLLSKVSHSSLEIYISYLTRFGYGQRHKKRLRIQV